MSGFIISMRGAAVSWCARQQEVVALSSTEAEFISLCSCVKEVVWMRRLLGGFGLGLDLSVPTTILVDNQGGKDLLKMNQ